TASSGSLAFTGSGHGTRWTATIGFGLLLAGLCLLAVGEGPRRMLRQIAFSAGPRVRRRSTVTPPNPAHLPDPARLADTARRYADWLLGR
ncbi:MAG TPA: hypothetical protein VK386_03530, partial [Acidimicrobiales bacterium]|nr:hypothetical protein [Acidimicrobiales bacterium]